MDQHIERLTAMRGKYGHDAQARALVERCLELCRRAMSVREDQRAKLREEVDGLLAQLRDRTGRGPDSDQNG